MASYNSTSPRSGSDDGHCQQEGSSAQSEMPQTSDSEIQNPSCPSSDSSCHDEASCNLDAPGPAAGLVHSDLASEQAFLLQLIDNERSLQGAVSASDAVQDHADELRLYYSPYGLPPNGLCSDPLGLYHPAPTLEDDGGKPSSRFVNHSSALPSAPAFMSVHDCTASSAETGRVLVHEGECGSPACSYPSSSPACLASTGGRSEESPRRSGDCSSVQASPLLSSLVCRQESLPPLYSSDPRIIHSGSRAPTGGPHDTGGSEELGSALQGFPTRSSCSALSRPALRAETPGYPGYPYDVSYAESEEELSTKGVGHAGVGDQTTAATDVGALGPPSHSCNVKGVRSPAGRTSPLMYQPVQVTSQQRLVDFEDGPQRLLGDDPAFQTRGVEHKPDQVSRLSSQVRVGVHAREEGQGAEEGQGSRGRSPGRGLGPCANPPPTLQYPLRRETKEGTGSGCTPIVRSRSFSGGERRCDVVAAEGEPRRADPRESESQIRRTTEDLIYLQNMVCVATSIVMTRKNKRLTPDDFLLLKVIGKGSYGKVMLVQFKQDGRVYAMKMLRKEAVIRRNQVEHTRTERDVLAWVSHPFIVQLHYAFQTRKKLYFVLEYCPGGELFFHLSRAGRFTECRVRFYSAEVLLALEHLHSYNIVYRDLKPENVLLDDQGHIRLTDFGLSKEGVEDNVSARSLCGTPEYLAPEILNQRGHGKAVDWWSLGALIYEMLTGLPPFYSGDRERLFENIRSSELQYPTYMSAVAVDLLKRLLQRDPDKRLGGGPLDAEEIKSATDVQYFDKEFVKLPVINSEVHESPIGVAAEDLEEQAHTPRDAGQAVDLFSPSSTVPAYQKHADCGDEPPRSGSPAATCLLQGGGYCFSYSSHGSDNAAERGAPHLPGNECGSSTAGRVLADFPLDPAGKADSSLKPGGGDPRSHLREVENHATADTLASHGGLLSYGAGAGEGVSTPQDNSSGGAPAFEAHLVVSNPPFDDDSDDSLFEGFTYDERTDNTLGEAAGVSGSYPGGDEVD